jgi:hypothetical protein
MEHFGLPSTKDKEPRTRGALYLEGRKEVLVAYFPGQAIEGRKEGRKVA